MKMKAKQKLYVVFHGTFAFVLHENAVGKGGVVDVLIPAVDGHTYGAGGWKCEVVLDKGKHYRLCGPKAGNGKPNETEQVVISRGRSCVLGTEESNLYCRLRMNLPDKIRGLRCILKQEECFVGDAVNQNDMGRIKRLPLVHLFVYEQFDGTGYISLNDSSDETIVKLDMAKEIAFHFWAEPAFRMHQMHPLTSFDQVRGLLPGLDLGLKEAVIGFPPDKACKTPEEILGQDRNLFERCHPDPSKPGCQDARLDHTHIGNCLSVYVRS
jgi:hypothetical protein